MIDDLTDLTDKWYSGKDVPETPEPMTPGAWLDLPFTRFEPYWDGDVILELYVYLRLRLRANFPHGQIQIQVMREGTNPPDPAAPDDITVGRRNQTLAQMTTASPEFGRPIRQLWVGECRQDTPLTWQVYLGPEFLSGGRSTLYAKAYRQIRPWRLT